MSLGSTLKAAREARNLSAEDIADQTHIFIQVIEKIEADDFSRIPAPVYGRGFIKHYAECVGLDPEPLIAEFMEAYTGRKPAVKVARSHEPAPAPHPPAPPPVEEEEPPAAPFEPAEPPPVVEEPVAEEPPAAIPEPPPAPAFPPSYGGTADIPPSAMDLPLFAPPPPPAPAQQQTNSRAGVFSSRWAAEDEPPAPQAPARKQKRQTAHDLRKAVTSASHSIFSNMGRGLAQAQRIPPAVWRYGLLALGGILLLFGLIKGCTALYRLTGSDDGKEAAQAGEVSEAAPAQPAEEAAGAAKGESSAAPADASDAPKPLPSNKLRSTGEKIPSLYID